MTAGAPLFERRTVAWAVGLSIASFLLAFVLAAYGDLLTDDVSAGPDSLSTSAIGHHALATLLERLGLDVERRTSPRIGPLGPTTPLLLLEPGTRELLGSWRDVPALLDLAAARGAATVLALPKRSGAADPAGRWLERAALLPLPLVERRLGGLLQRDDTDESSAVEVRREEGLKQRTCAERAGEASPPAPGYRVGIRDLQWIAPHPGVTPVVTCDDMTLIALIDDDGSDGSDGAHTVWLISDPDLFNNLGLAEGEHAALMRDLLVERLGATGVVFDETLHGHESSRSLVAELLSFPLVLAVLHGLLAIGAIVWSGARRFGTPRPAAPPHADGKRILIDNAAQLLSLGGHSAETLELYFRRTLTVVATRYGLAPDRPLDALTAELQRISDGRGVEIALDRIRARIGDGTPSDDRAVRLAHHLHRWRKEMTDGTRRDS